MELALPNSIFTLVQLKLKFTVVFLPLDFFFTEIN